MIDLFQGTNEQTFFGAARSLILKSTPGASNCLFGDIIWTKTGKHSGEQSHKKGMDQHKLSLSFAHLLFTLLLLFTQFQKSNSRVPTNIISDNSFESIQCTKSRKPGSLEDAG